jgi:hypothetical protein
MDESLSDEVTIYRTILAQSKYNKATKKPLAVVFLRRPPHEGKERDVKGLSVEFGIDPDQCGKHFAAKAAVAKLLVGFIRQHALDAVPDEPNHANITGLPKQQDDLAEANRLANILAEHADVIYEFPR